MILHVILEQMTQSTDVRLYFSNYMHGHHPPLPHSWSPPPFVDRPDANPSTWTSQGNPRPPFDASLNPQIGLHSASSSNVDEIEDAMPASSPSVHDTVHTEGADIVEEPKLGMLFNSEEELLAYYKRYGQQCGFGVITQKSHRFEDVSLRYVTLGCAYGGKAHNRTSNVVRPGPTSKNDCKARINATLEKGLLKVSSVYNFHNYGLSPQKSRFFRCNREVNESVKRVLDIND
ncbi:hypothetical protein I3843_04G118700 [Carya illinoinensis]|nr:hypothetical protein I3843_04G118700 [Carya illinoinensis]